MFRIFIVMVLVISMACGGNTFGQVPANPPQRLKIEMKPLVNFDKVIDQIKGHFTKILREYWAWFLSLFFAWFALQCFKAFLDGKMEKRMAQMKAKESQLRRENDMAEKKAAELSRRAERLESEYRTRGQYQEIVLRENESIANIDGKQYIRELSSGVVSYKTMEQWQSERDSELDKPLDFDNNDYGRIYDSIVDKDSKGKVADERSEYDFSVKEKSDELDSLTLPYDGWDLDDWRKWRDSDESKDESGLYGWFQPSKKRREHIGSGLDDPIDYDDRTGRSGGY
jgi:hypothetical protein